MPNALPIYSAGYKKQFDSPVDSWHASIGIANGALMTGRLDLPTVGAVYNFAAMGMENVGLTAEEIQGGLPAHSLWPFIAASLGYQGTRGPCFFLVRSLKDGEYGQLISLLKKAALKSVKLKSELSNYEPLFAAIATKKLASGKLPLAERLIKAMDKRANAREKLDNILQVRALAATGKTRELYEMILAALKTSDTLRPFISAVSSTEDLLSSEKIPVVRAFLVAALEKEDLAALPVVIANDELKSVWTDARKAFQEIDFSLYGPQIADSSLQMKL